MPIALGLFVVALIFSVWIVLKGTLLVLFVAAMIVVFCAAISQGKPEGYVVGVAAAVIFLMVVGSFAKDAFDESTKVNEGFTERSHWAVDFGNAGRSLTMRIAFNANGEETVVTCFMKNTEQLAHQYYITTQLPDYGHIMLQFPRDFGPTGIEDSKPTYGKYRLTCGAVMPNNYNKWPATHVWEEQDFGVHVYPAMKLAGQDKVLF